MPVIHMWTVNGWLVSNVATRVYFSGFYAL